MFFFDYIFPRNPEKEIINYNQLGNILQNTFSEKGICNIIKDYLIEMEIVYIRYEDDTCEEGRNEVWRNAKAIDWEHISLHHKLYAAPEICPACRISLEGTFHESLGEGLP